MRTPPDGRLVRLALTRFVPPHRHPEEKRIVGNIVGPRRRGRTAAGQEARGKLLVFDEP